MADTIVSQAQEAMHTSSFVYVMPAVLVASSVVILAYRGLTEEEHMRPLNGFLANVLLQNIPLAMLKYKVWTCADRVSLMPMVVCKTLLTHVFLGAFRVISPMVGDYPPDKLTFALDTMLLLAALGILKLEFNFSMNPMNWFEHKDVRTLVALSFAAAFVLEEWLSIVPASWLSEKQASQASRRSMDLGKVCFTTANYLDIVAFTPVVWRLYQVEDRDDSNVGAAVTSNARKQLQLFFLFIGAFYMHDDVLDPVLNLLDEPLAMMAHAMHFMLLLDLMGFFFYQVEKPAATQSKEQTEQLQTLLGAPNDFDDEC